MKKIVNSNKKGILSGNSGSAIVIAMLTLLIVTMIGISTMDNSTTEKMIAVNDMLYKQSFSAADGGTQVAQELVEQNLGCPNGFFPNDNYSTFPEAGVFPTPDDDITTTFTDGNPPLFLKAGKNGNAPNKASDTSEALLAVMDSNFAIDRYNGRPNNVPCDDPGMRDIYFVENAPLPAPMTAPSIPTCSGDTNAKTVPHTNIIAAEQATKFIAGNSILMAEGYSGLGKGGGSGGAEILYDIHSKNEYNARNSCAYIIVEYRHIVGREGDCEYK